MVDVSDALNPSSGDLLTYNGATWTNAQKPSYNLDELTDVQVSSAAN